MSEPKDINVSRRLREQAEQLENLALEAESRSSFQLNGVEEEELGELVKFLRGKLGDIRLANLRARLDDIDNILNLFRCRPARTAQRQRIPHFQLARGNIKR